MFLIVTCLWMCQLKSGQQLSPTSIVALLLFLLNYLLPPEFGSLPLNPLWNTETNENFLRIHINLCFLFFFFLDCLWFLLLFLLRWLFKHCFFFFLQCHLSVIDLVCIALLLFLLNYLLLSGFGSLTHALIWNTEANDIVLRNQINLCFISCLWFLFL